MGERETVASPLTAAVKLRVFLRLLEENEGELFNVLRREPLEIRWHDKLP